MPGAVDRYAFPALPPELDAGLEVGNMTLVLVSMIMEGRFDFDDFTYGDLGFAQRKSYSVNVIRFFP